MKKILKLDKTKASQKIDITTRTIKEHIVIFAEFLCTNINRAIKSVSFPSSLKLSDVTPLHKKGRKDIKEKHDDNDNIPHMVHENVDDLIILYGI